MFAYHYNTVYGFRGSPSWHNIRGIACLSFENVSDTTSLSFSLTKTRLSASALRPLLARSTFFLLLSSFASHFSPLLSRTVTSLLTQHTHIHIHSIYREGLSETRGSNSAPLTRWKLTTSTTLRPMVCIRRYWIFSCECTRRPCRIAGARGGGRRG